MTAPQLCVLVYADDAVTSSTQVKQVPRRKLSEPTRTPQQGSPGPEIRSDHSRQKTQLHERYALLVQINQLERTNRWQHRRLHSWYNCISKEAWQTAQLVPAGGQQLPLSGYLELCVTLVERYKAHRMLLLALIISNDTLLLGLPSLQLTPQVTHGKARTGVLVEEVPIVYSNQLQKMNIK